MSNTKLLGKTKELKVTAEMKHLDRIIDFVIKGLDNYNCSNKLKNQIALVMEEIYCNIVNYGYKQKKGEVIIKYYINNQRIVIVIMDNGNKFNPLVIHEPDVTLQTEKREVGGMGIFLVKRTVDKISYRFNNGKNILTFMKMISE